MEKFERPDDMLVRQDEFSALEVGLTHPTTPAFVRLANNGDVEIIASEGLGIILHPSKGSITFMAEKVKFMTQDDGLQWNNLKFNKEAQQFNQPTFTQVEENAMQSIYRGVEQFAPEFNRVANPGADAISPVPDDEDEWNPEPGASR